MPQKAPATPIDSKLWGDMSPTVKLAQLEYESAGITPWSNDQVVRLCLLLKCTVRELAALSGMFELMHLKRFWNRNSWPLEISLQFHKLRRFRLGLRTPDVHDAMTARVLEKSYTREELEAVHG